MPKLFFWKGSAHLGIPKSSSGSTYDSWQSATNITNLQNWYSVADGENIIKGATALPTLTDKVYINDRCPNLGSRRQYIGKDEYSSETISPCINSSGATLSALSVDIGPFVGSKSVPKKEWMITNWGSSFLAKIPSENINPDNLLLSTGSSFVGLDKTYKTYYQSSFGYEGGGNELKINASNITILDSNLGTYDITIVPSLVNSVSRVEIKESDIGAIRRISHWTHPWKKETSIRLGENSNVSFIGVSAGIYVNRLSIESGTILTTVGGVSGATASNLQGGGGTYATPNVVLEGQIDNFIIKPSSTTNIKHVRIAPIVVCNETISNYYFETSVLRVGNTKNLSPQTDPAFADIILENSRWFESNRKIPLSNYGVILGSSVWNKEQDYKTQFKFSTSLKSATSTEQIRKFFTGSPSVYLRGNCGILDFILNTGQITLDYNNISTNYGVLCGNGKITSSGTVLFESQIKCSSSEKYPLCMGQWGITYSVGTTQYGIQIDSTRPYPIKYPKNSIIRSHISPWISPPVGGVADMETGAISREFTEGLNNCNRRENNDIFPKGLNPNVLNPVDWDNDGEIGAMDIYMSSGAYVMDDFLNSLPLNANSYWGGQEYGDKTYNPEFAKDLLYQYQYGRSDQDQLIGGAADGGSGTLSFEPMLPGEDLLDYTRRVYPIDNNKPGVIPNDITSSPPIWGGPEWPNPFDGPRYEDENWANDPWDFDCWRAKHVYETIPGHLVFNPQTEKWEITPSLTYPPYGPWWMDGCTDSCEECREKWLKWKMEQVQQCIMDAAMGHQPHICSVRCWGGIHPQNEPHFPEVQPEPGMIENYQILSWPGEAYECDMPSFRDFCNYRASPPAEGLGWNFNPCSFGPNWTFNLAGMVCKVSVFIDLGPAITRAGNGQNPFPRNIPGPPRYPPIHTTPPGGGGRGTGRGSGGAEPLGDPGNTNPGNTNPQQPPQHEPPGLPINSPPPPGGGDPLGIPPGTQPPQPPPTGTERGGR